MTGNEIFRATLPPGRHKLPPDFVAWHQRTRLFAAIVLLVDEHGYPAVSLTRIVKKAGVARHTFYEHFEGKDALFLALFDEAVERALSVTVEAMETEGGPWEAQIRAGLRALLALFARDPARTRVTMIESQSAGPAALARRTVAMARFAEILRLGREGDSRGVTVPAPTEDILLGGAIWMINRQLIADESGIEELLPELLEYLVAPYCGNAAAWKIARRGAGDESPTAERGR